MKLSPLICACYYGKLEVVSLLLQNDFIDVDFSSEPELISPLIVSIYKGYYEIIKVLLSKNCNVNIVTRNGYFPLLTCLSRLDEENYKYENEVLCLMIMKLLIENGADVNKSFDSNPKHTILYKLLTFRVLNEERYENIATIIKFIIERGADKRLLYSENEKDNWLEKIIYDGPYKDKIIELVLETTQIYHNKTIKGRKNESNNKSMKESSIILYDNNEENGNCCIIF